MKTYQNALCIMVATTMVIFTGCTEKKAETTLDAEEFADSVSASTFPSETIAFEKRKFIKTGDLRFKVKNVQEASNSIEDIVEKYDGFITHSELSSNTTHVNEVEISEDSILLNKAYEVSNKITLRIPNQNFDKVLREIQPVMTFLEYKKVSADDVSLNLLASDLRKKRFSEFENRYKKEIATKGKKLAETANSEEKLFDYQTQADMNKVETLNIKDQVNYSTLEIEVFQPITNMIELQPNMDNDFAYQPHFLKRIWQSFRTGWFVFEEVLVFITKFWMLILLLSGGFWLYKVYFKTSKV
ncbi:DUF4349 domain-containing protein [Arcicella rosea]|uniref:Putative component of type VI protein secretion system n=1 Tax=Arcicella rosea TaxID=502909 RepID=A0A841EP97_9BACT|nr:DUF4349 domain-containing protein [Arcicella rosea]MBB6004034.1 putative component of type VI protein secretion system [Arcicella rosea]